MVAHRPDPGQHEAPKISYVDEKPLNEKHLFAEDLLRREHHENPHHDLRDHDELPLEQHHYHSPAMNDYHELVTAHSLEPFKSKPHSDPLIHYHDYQDFPPEFYKAEYYSFYHKLGDDMMTPD